MKNGETQVYQINYFLDSPRDLHPVSFSHCQLLISFDCRPLLFYIFNLRIIFNGFTSKFEAL